MQGYGLPSGGGQLCLQNLPAVGWFRTAGDRCLATAPVVIAVRLIYLSPKLACFALGQQAGRPIRLGVIFAVLILVFASFTSAYIVMGSLVPTYYPPVMENQMEKKMENEMETLSPFKEYIGILSPYNGESNGKENGK